MKPGQSAFQADLETYETASKETANLCCRWLQASGHAQAALELAEYLNSDGLEIVPQEQAAPSAQTQRAEAQMKGYVLVRNGTCLKCDTCGSTTGCS